MVFNKIIIIKDIFNLKINKLVYFLFITLITYKYRYLEVDDLKLFDKLKMLICIKNFDDTM